DHRPDRDGDSAERHYVGGDSHRRHRDKREDDGDRDRQDRDDRARDMPEEDEDHEADDEEFFAQRMLQRVDRTVDERRSVVRHNYPTSRRQRLLPLSELALDAVDHAQRIPPMPHDDDAADRLTVSVQLDEAAAKIRTQVNRADVADENRRSVAV